jgi:transcriptional regulator with XRE-family HTH domain
VKTSKEIIGKKIKIQRKKKQMTLNELADKLNADRQYVWRLENGKINMSLNYLDKIIEKLGCRHEDFFNETETI